MLGGLGSRPLVTQSRHGVPRISTCLPGPGCPTSGGVSTLGLPEQTPSQVTKTLYVPNLTTFVGLSDIGRTRTRNEDSLAMLPSSGIAIVADGMGGHPGGDVASRIAAEKTGEMLEASLGSEAPAQGRLAGMRATMLESVMSAHLAVRAAVAQDEELEGMGTTITAMALDVDRDQYVLGHVGDSRAYRLRAGKLVQLTRDDTWVQERVDANELTPEQARHHPYSHILTQCVGLEEPPAPHVHDGTAVARDVYLLCSDGLVGMLDDEDIVRILRKQLGGAPRPEALEVAAQELVAAANEAGGHDNITVSLVLIA